MDDRCSPGMLAAQYAATRMPKGLKRLIIANSPASIKLATQGTDALLEKFPADYVEKVRKHEAEGTLESTEYQELASAFYKKHTCTVDPWPQELLKTFEVFEKDQTVARAM